jgi:hypothetical protein
MVCVLQSADIGYGYPKPISVGTLLHTSNCPPADMHSKQELSIQNWTKYYIING